MQEGQRILPMVEKELDFDETDPYLNLSYDITDNTMAYVSYSEGFKSGGFSQRVFPPILPGMPGVPPEITSPDDPDLIPTFEPEYVKVYEVGFKYTGFENRFPAERRDFLYRLRRHADPDLHECGPDYEKPRPKRRSSVFELRHRSFPWTRGSWKPAWVISMPSMTRSIRQETFVDKNNRLDRVSDWTLNAATFYEIGIGGAGTFVPRLEWAYRSKFENDAFNTLEIRQDDYHLVNASLTWRNAEDNISIIAGINESDG